MEKSVQLAQLIYAMKGLPISCLLNDLSAKLSALASFGVPPKAGSPTFSAGKVIGDTNVDALIRTGFTLLTKKQRQDWLARHSDVCVYLAAIRDIASEASAPTQPASPTWDALLDEVAPTDDDKEALRKSLSALIAPSPCLEPAT